jgi:hypothetical protein
MSETPESAASGPAKKPRNCHREQNIPECQQAVKVFPWFGQAWIETHAVEEDENIRTKW